MPSETHETEHDESGQKRGWLRHGNPPGDFSKAPRCQAKTRQQGACRQPAMPNGRCRMHGGLSSGAKTIEGKKAAQQAITKHGFYSEITQQENQLVKGYLAQLDVFLDHLKAK